MRATAVLIGLIALLPVRAAPAQGLSLSPAWSEEPALPRAVQAPGHTDVRLTVAWENDGGPTTFWDRKDRHYTAAMGASVTWRAPWVDTLATALPSIGEEFRHADTTGAMGLVGNLTIYGPENIAAFDLASIADDRPYAGWTYGGIFLQRAVRPGETRRYNDGYHGLADLFKLDTYGRFESIELDLGLLGPSSLAQNAQELVHRTLAYQYPNGWDHQIHDTPAFSIKYERRWRSDYFLLTEGGHGFDVLPELGMTAGTLVDDVRLGVMLRVGILPDDFGPGELARPADFTRPGGFDPPFAIYLFGRPYGRFVAYNALLQGNPWRDDDPVTRSPEPFVFATQFGIGIRILSCFDLTYSMTYQSPEFHGQRDWDSWSSLQVSFVCAW